MQIYRLQAARAKDREAVQNAKEYMKNAEKGMRKDEINRSMVQIQQDANESLVKAIFLLDQVSYSAIEFITLNAMKL